MTRPFKIESADINRLTDIHLTQLLHELLQAEAHKYGIAQRSGEVALNIRVGDGGEDGRISWDGGPDETDFIPNRLTMFQNKATTMGPTAYANEIVTKARSGYPSTLKPKVEEVLDKGGTYIVFTTEELNTKQKDLRIANVRGKLRDFGKVYADTCQIKIYDAALIASWVNNFIPTIVSVQHWIGSPIERGLKTFSLWSEHEDLSSLPFVAVESRKDILETLTEKIEEPKSCFRIMGLSGLGKTRTAFQIFKESKSLRYRVIFVDANHAPTIDALVADWVGLGLEAIVVVDNCEYRLHERLVKEVRRNSSQISLLTLDYNLDSVSPLSVCYRLNQMTDEELTQLLSPVYKEQLPDLDRVISFAQGFPQMAVLLAEARLSEDPRIGELTEDDLARKLLWRHGEEDDEERTKILQACSLFDIFGVEKEAEPQLQFIANIVGIDIDKVYECVQEYSERGIIDRRGRFGQVVPKPLAIRLAGQWWAKSREQKQKELIENIPEGMVEGFCDQVEKLDFHTDVKKLTESLCGPQGPFGQAEVILSIRGSRLFRAFVVVNSESTSKALYKTLDSLDLQQLAAIDGDTRRNLVWALERLCYHAEVFREAAWCLMLLASAENESWSNNAIGMFAQLFRLQLSGTAAPPKTRLSLIKRALKCNSLQIDMVLLEALHEATKIHGGSRSVGAEYQGSKPPLKEWRPKIWQEIFDYWQEAFNFLLILFERGEAQKQQVLSIIGHSVRGFVGNGRIEMLDAAIRYIVSINGRYWPAALDSIKNTFEYDSASLRPEAEEALNTWLELLSPKDAELSEKLKILVINPPWEHQKGDDGHHVDVAAENAKVLATEVSKNIEDLLPLLNLLIEGEQKQTYSFGNQLAVELDDATQLLELSFEKLVSIDQSNPSFMLGIYRGVYEKSPEDWQILLDKLVADKRLVYLYPDFILTGTIQEQHLTNLLGLIRSGLIPPKRASTLSYGSVTDGISPDTMADFCLSLAELGDLASWTALDVIYMYSHGNKGSVNLLRVPLKHLVTTVPLHKKHEGNVNDVYKWRELAEKLLKERDQEFAIALSRQLINSSQDGLDHGDIWHYIKPFLLDLMREYGDVLWPLFGDAIIQAEGMNRYWLQQLLDRDNSLSNNTPSVLSVVPVNSIMNWCEKHPEVGPNFVASTLNVFETLDDKQQPTALFIALLERFGDDKRVRSALGANLGTGGWSGSIIPYLESDKAALSPLLKHENDYVRSWVKDHITYVDKQIKFEIMRDEERQIGLF